MIENLGATLVCLAGIIVQEFTDKQKLVLVFELCDSFNVTGYLQFTGGNLNVSFFKRTRNITILPLWV